MLLNTASQSIGAQMVSATDGSAFTGSVTVAVTIDSGTQATGTVGSGACAHEGGGYHSYRPSQAETNGAHIAFTFSGTGAVPVTVQAFTRAGDAFTRLGAPAGASVSADILVIDNLVDDLESRLGTPSNLGGGATIAANLSDIEAQTDDIGVAGAGLTAADDAIIAALATVDGIVDDIKQMLGHKTTIATLASQTSFTLTAGSADDNAYNGWGAFVVDASTATQIALGVVNDYTGSTKTITLREDPGIFTMAASDHIILLPGKLTDGVNVTQIEGVDATDQLDAHAAAGATAEEIADEVQTRTIAAVTVVNGLAANVITAAATAADFTTEIQNGLATAAAVADLPTNAELATALAAADDAVLAAIAALENLSAAEVNAEVVDALATDVVADSVPADGSRPTIAQALYMLTQFMLERSVSGTTLTVNKPDGTTPLMTLTLDDGTSPTAITRAT